MTALITLGGQIVKLAADPASIYRSAAGSDLDGLELGVGFKLFTTYSTSVDKPSESIVSVSYLKWPRPMLPLPDSSSLEAFQSEDTDIRPVFVAEHALGEVIQTTLVRRQLIPLFV